MNRMGFGNRSPMTASANRLLKILPISLIMRFEGVDGVDVQPAHIDLLDGKGAPTVLRADYPGFMNSFEALLISGRVLHVADRKREARPGCFRIDRHFLVVRASL